MGTKDQRGFVKIIVTANERLNAMRWMKRRIQRSRDRCHKAFKVKTKEFSRSTAAGQSAPLERNVGSCAPMGLLR